jgi:hypothetical protein
MKKLLFIPIVMAMACGGSLSDEQRKKLHEGMEEQKIVKISDAEIVTASLERGRTIYKEMEKLKFDSLKMDSISERYHVKIKLITPGSSQALEVEQQLIEAYVVGAETGSVQDNIQKLHTTTDPKNYDSLIYTRPKVLPMTDGAVKVEGIWNIYLPKKDVILSIDKH